MKKMTKWIKSPLGIAIISPMIGFVLTIGYDALKSKPILSTIASILVAIWGFFIMILNLELKVWWILVSIIIIALCVYIIVGIKLKDNSGSETLEFLQYTKDTIKGFSWEWSWEKTYDGKWDIRDLQPVCSVCYTPLVPDTQFFSGRPVCPRCDWQPSVRLPDLDHIKLLIIDNARKSNFTVVS